MAGKVVRLASLRVACWRAAALAVLILPACAAAQQDSPATPAVSNADRPAVSVEQTLTRVRELYAARQFAAALKPLEQHLAVDDGNTVVRLEYARTLAILRRFPEAAREYRRVLETEPQNAAAMVGLAKVAAWQGQRLLALETYDRVLTHDPEFYDALVGKAFLLMWMGRRQDARALFLQAQRQHPNDPEVREALASLGSPAAEEAAAPAPRAEPAAEAGKPALPDARKPAASDAAGAAPAEAPKPLPGETVKPAPPAAVMSPSAALGPASMATVAMAPGSAENPPVIPATAEPSAAPPQAREDAVPLPARKAHKEIAAATAAVRQNPAPAPSDGRWPTRPAPTVPVRLAMLGMFATVVGAIAYRTYRVRRHVAPLATRPVFELPPSSLVSPPRPVATSAGSPLAGRAVLVVHPRESVRDLAQRVLAGAGAEVLVLERGDDAVAGLAKQPYDAIVVSDYLGQGRSGRELYRWLERNQPGAERRFVLVVTDETDPELQAFLEESRALVLAAPFGVSDLLAMTRLAMGRSQAQA